MKRGKTIWIATFDGASCRVFLYGGAPKQVTEIESERRLGPHKPDFADEPVTVFASAGGVRSGVAARTDHERKLEDVFVRDLAAHLAARAEAKAFDQLIVAAGPRALGAFRASAPKPLLEKVTREIPGDYANSPPGRLLEALHLP